MSIITSLLNLFVFIWPIMADRSFLLEKALTSSLADFKPQECDIIVSKQKLLPEIIENMITSNPIIFMDNEGINLPNSEVPCYVMVTQVFTANITLEISLAERVFYSLRAPMKLIILTPNDLDIYDFPKLPFNTNIVSGRNKEASKIMSYNVMNDNRWRILKAAFMLWYPELFLRKDGTFTGTGQDIWSILMRKVGFKIIYTKHVKAILGALDDIQQRKIDLVIPHGFYSESMSKGSDFSPSIFFDTYKFYNVKPGPVTSLLTLVYPFDTTVWLLLPASILFALFAAMLLKLKTPISSFNVILIVVSPLLNDSNLSKQRNPVHANWYGYSLLCVWLMSCLLLSQSYSSNLLANLTVVRREKADDTFKDLIENGRTLGVPRGSFIMHWLRNSPKDIVRKAEKECAQERKGYYDFNILKGVPSHIKDKLEMGEASSIIPEALFLKLEHKYRLGSDILIRTFNTYYIQKKHPFKEAIDRYIDQLTDMGIPEHIRQKYIWQTAKESRRYQRSAENNKERNMKVTNKHLSALWLVSMFGLILATLAFGTEFIKSFFYKNQYFSALKLLGASSQNLPHSPK